MVSRSTNCTIMKIDSTKKRTRSSAVITSTKPGQMMTEKRFEPRPIAIGYILPRAATARSASARPAMSWRISVTRS